MKPLLIHNRKLHLLKPYKNANYESKTVLTNSAWEYVDLYIKRTHKGKKGSLLYWNQAHNFYNASMQLPISSRPLAAYYCCLNAAKTLFYLYNGEKKYYHGLYGEHNEYKTLNNANIKCKAQPNGIMRVLSAYYGETTQKEIFSLKKALYNIPCVHRAYALTYSNYSEIFIPVSDIHFVLDSETNKIHLCFYVDKQFSYPNIKPTIPDVFEVVEANAVGKYKVIEKGGHDYTSEDNKLRYNQLRDYHNVIRPYFSYIFGDARLWYLKKKKQNDAFLDRGSITLIYAVTHWLSELVRYSPVVFDKYLNARENFLINEFIENSLHQFVDAISCEITHQEIMTTGYRK